MKYMGIDFGEERIGVAISDDKGIIASPYSIIKRKSDTEAIDLIRNICKKETVDKVVIGIPQVFSNLHKPQTNRIKSFVNKCRIRLDIEIDTYTEAFTTKLAKLNNKKLRRVDAVAAAYILQFYLDNQRLQSISTPLTY